MTDVSPESCESTSLNTYTSENDLKRVYADQLKCKKIPIDHLNFHEKIGSGQFGDVFKGTFQINVCQNFNFILFKRLKIKFKIWKLKELVEVAIKKLKLEDSNENLEEQYSITKKFVKEASMR